MRRNDLLLLLLALGPACVEPPDGDDSGPATCDITIDETWPLGGAQDVYHRDSLEFTLSEPDPDALVVAEFPGEQSFIGEGEIVLYTPAEPLEPDQDYTVGLDYCHGSPRIDFHTSTYGLDLEEDSDLVGSTFAVDLTSGRFGLGATMAEGLSAFFDRAILFQILGAWPGGIALRVAISEPIGSGGAQDPCYRTTEFADLATEQAPFFGFELADFVLGAQ